MGRIVVIHSALLGGNSKTFDKVRDYLSQQKESEQTTENLYSLIHHINSEVDFDTLKTQVEKDNHFLESELDVEDLSELVEQFCGILSPEDVAETANFCDETCTLWRYGNYKFMYLPSGNRDKKVVTFTNQETGEKVELTMKAICELFIQNANGNNVFSDFDNSIAEVTVKRQR